MAKKSTTSNKTFLEKYYSIALRGQENKGGGLGAAVVIYMLLAFIGISLASILQFIDILTPVALILQMLIVAYCGVGIIITILVYFNIIDPNQSKAKAKKKIKTRKSNL